MHSQVLLLHFLPNFHLKEHPEDFHHLDQNYLILQHHKRNGWEGLLLKTQRAPAMITNTPNYGNYIFFFLLYCSLALLSTLYTTVCNSLNFWDIGMYQDLNTPNIVASLIPYVLGALDIFCTFLKADSLYNKSFYTLQFFFKSLYSKMDPRYTYPHVLRLRESTFERDIYIKNRNKFHVLYRKSKFTGLMWTHFSMCNLKMNSLR